MNGDGIGKVIMGENFDFWEEEGYFISYGFGNCGITNEGTDVESVFA